MKKFQYAPDNQAIIEASPMPFAIYQFLDNKVEVVALSIGFCELFGLGRLEVAYRRMQEDMFSLMHPEDELRVKEAILRFALEDGDLNVVYRSRLGVENSTDYAVIHAMGRHVFTDTGDRLAHVWYTREGTYEAEQAQGPGELNRSFNQVLREGSMAYQNRYDPITGLPNMTFFFELADKGTAALRAAGRRGAILFIDLCGMKAFNNRWGFAGGDKLIRAFGALLSECFGEECCARFGQDHFAAYAEADGLEARLGGLFEGAKRLNDGNTLPVRAGIYLGQEHAVEIGKACDLAKMACDVNRVAAVSHYTYFEEKLLEEAERRQYIIDNLDRAIAEGWIKVYYQPIIRAANGRVCDEEALSRWIDPVKGFLSPAEFIPALEEANLIYRLDLYVVEQVLEKMKRQAATGLYVVPESVNLSRTDFDSCDIVEEIRSRVDAAGIDRSMLTIEITESVVGSDFDFIKEQVERFHSLGFKVWMDDFGSGYSSLDVLQNIHFDLIKFDMRFMQHFNDGEEGRIILTELVKMAIGLGVDTVCEGVEQAQQVEFLREIGCTKIQGFYYCKPIPYEEIVNRYEKGLQIGFENPEESDYFTAIGRVNLYDMAVIAGERDESFNNYFDTLPMAIIEVNDTRARYARCNKSYRDFMLRTFGITDITAEMNFNAMTEGPGTAFLDALVRCSRDGNRAVIDDAISASATVHALFRRIAVNSVTGTAAVAVAVLAIIDQKDEGTTYEHIARALSADYMNLYYVDLATEEFIEYRSVANRADISVERRGVDFFNASREDAKLFLYREDQAFFIEAFTRENIVRSLDEQGTFALTYRLMAGGEPMYVSMKVVRMQADPGHIIVGISNVDAQVREKEALARVRAEQANFTRIAALSGNYIAIYTVEPDTGNYYQFSASKDYAGLGLTTKGERFFDSALMESGSVVLPEDRERFKTMFTRDNVMREIERNGLFSINYRILLGGEPTHVSARAVLCEEQGDAQLVIGVSNIEAQVRREQDYERKLSAARGKVNLDGLTGVRNRMAYESMSESLTRQIEEGRPVQYAIILCRVAGIQEANKLLGRQEGDQLIRKACAIICNTFKHSPVFRVAGDEFAVIAQGQDYEARDALLDQIGREGRLNDCAAITCGMSQYHGGESVSAVFARAEAQSKGEAAE